jgi:ABC-2 type transport system permease protein
VSTAPMNSAPTPVRDREPARPYRSAVPIQRVRLRDGLASEWAKITTVRSTYWTLIATVLVSIGASIGLAAAFVASWNSIDPATRATLDISYPLVGIQFGMLVIAVLGVLAISGEYSTGMIRTSLTAYPRRAWMFGAKLAVLAAVALATGLVVSWGSYLAAAPIYGTKGVRLPLGQSGNLRAVLAAAVAIMLVALFGFGMGSLLRHTAGAITAVLGLLFVVPIITSLLPGSTGRAINRLMPSQAAQAMFITTSNITGRYLSPLGGFLTLLIWVAAFCVAAFVLFRRRDA